MEYLSESSDLLSQTPMHAEFALNMGLGNGIGDQITPESIQKQVVRGRFINKEQVKKFQDLLFDEKTKNLEGKYL